MRIPFRSFVQVTAGPTQTSAATHWREVSLHASNLHEAADRFLRAQLNRKRARQFACQH
jgi:hypothetical protein